MKKRGQVYILAAIILAIVLFSLAAIRNKFEQEEIRGDFESLSENYQIEASKLINSVIESGGDVHESFKSFSTMFTAYAKGKNPRYGLVYILSFQNRIQITNFLNNSIIVKGCGYSVTVPGYFSKVPADISFEGFNIEEDISWGEVQVECENIEVPSGDIIISNRFCAFVPPTSGETRLAVVIDAVPYYLCVEEGVPELMQVSMMKQGEQSKVRGTGKCIGKDFCSGFTNQNDCEEECGQGVCCWWIGAGGMCLSNYSNPSRCSGKCIHGGDIFCLGDKKWYYDSCGVPEVNGFVEDCAAEEKVCRDTIHKEGLPTQCCEEEDSKACSNNNIYWYSSCGTEEGLFKECEDDEVCQDLGTGPDCCKLEYEMRCDENNIYYYSSCGIKGDLALECNEEEGWVCRDQEQGLSEARCCIENFEQKCEGNSIYYYSSCGTREGLVEDCEQQNKPCVCDSLGCDCKEFKLRCASQTTYSNNCGECVGSCNDEDDCESGYRCTPKGDILVAIYERDGCSWGREKCRIVCKDAYYTECSASPSCQEGYDPIGGPISC